MGRIWEAENRYAKWLEVEIAACEAMAEEKIIPREAVENIKKKARFSVERILEIEEETKHDVIAFLTNVEEYVGPDSRYIHLGLTSSDVLDTSFALLLREAMTLIINDVKEFMTVLRERAMEHKDTIMVGRSHGIHAEPITLGLKLAVWYSEMKRNLKRLEEALEVISFGKLSGAVGTFANIPPEVEARACKKLGLKAAPISTQIIQRDRHAGVFTTLAIVAGTLEKIAVEIRHLQRTEVHEAEKNTIGSENISGLARLVRSNALAALENMPLWHERDISHSSVERVIGPDSTILLDFMLIRLGNIVRNLVVFPETMLENLQKTGGLIFSQQVLMRLAEKGLERQKAYVMVQRNALRVWEEKMPFKELLLEDREIGKYLGKEEIEEIFDLSYHLKHVDDIFERVFSE